MVKRVGKYEIGKVLGEGTFGKVKLAVNTETKERIAIKVLDKQKILRQNMAEHIKKEISIMKLIHHRNVVNLKDVLVSKTKIYLCLELVSGGELFYKLASEGRFSEDVARRYFQQLIDGVSYCHLQHVVHRDLKPENLLLDETGSLKISDFGLSSLFGGGSSSSDQGASSSSSSSSSSATKTPAGMAPELLHTTCGTPNYVAPEVLEDQGYDGRKADIWSCGVILYVFLCGFLPFEDDSTSALFEKIRNASFQFPPWVSDEAQNLVLRILVPDPAKRATMDEIKAHPWFTPGYTASTGAELSLEGLDPTKVFQSVDEHESGEFRGTSLGDSGPLALNAFELISISGALNVSRILTTSKPEDDVVKRWTRFTTTVDADNILAVLQDVLAGEEMVVFKVEEQTYKVMASAYTGSGPIQWTVQIFQMAPTINMVDFKKTKGNIIEFVKFYRRIKSKLLAKFTEAFPESSSSTPPDSTSPVAKTVSKTNS